MASPSPLFDTTMHLRSRWIRADYAAGAFAVGAVSAYVVGRSSFAGRPISSPHAAAEIGFSGLVAPQSVTLDREQVWLLADQMERKPDGDYRRNAGRMPRIASHIDGALPWGLGEEAARRIVEGFSRWIVETYGVAVEFAAHHKEKPFDHAHFVVGTRSLEESSFGKKVRAFNGVAQHHADRKAGHAITHERQDGTVKHVSSAMDQIRAKWADLISAEIGRSIDHRSYERRGLAIEPVPRVRRGEIEFQKRQESRTGVGPAWRKDRRRRIAERSQLRPDVGDGPTAKHEVMRDGHMSLPIETSSHEKERRRHKASKRTREGEIADRWIEMLRAHLDRRQSPVSRAESDERGHRFDDAEDAYAKSLLGPTREATTRSWAAKAALTRVAHQEQRHTLTREQINQDLALRHRQRSALMLIARLKESNAALALRRLVEAARAFVEQGKLLVEAHDQQWLQLFASQKAAWRDALHEHVSSIDAKQAPSTQTPMHAPTAAAAASTTRNHRPSKPLEEQVATTWLRQLRSQLGEARPIQRGQWIERAIESDNLRIAQVHRDIRTDALSAVDRSTTAAGPNDPRFDSMVERLCARWDERLREVLISQRRAREEMLASQEREERLHLVRQRTILVLIERLIAADALHAMLRLIHAAKRLASETRTLLEKQGQDWLALLDAQRQQWPKPKLLSEKSKATPELAGTGHGIVEGSAATARVAPTTVPPKAAPASLVKDKSATPMGPANRSSEHIRIVEELADWLLLRNPRSQQKNSAMAAFLGERVEVFDARTNARRDAFVEATQTLGYSASRPQAPRSPKEIFHDPIVQGDAELLALVRAIAVRPPKTTAVHPLQRPVGPASMPKREGRKNEA